MCKVKTLNWKNCLILQSCVKIFLSELDYPKAHKCMYFLRSKMMKNHIHTVRKWLLRWSSRLNLFPQA